MTTFTKTLPQMSFNLNKSICFRSGAPTMTLLTGGRREGGREGEREGGWVGVRVGGWVGGYVYYIDRWRI